MATIKIPSQVHLSKQQQVQLQAMFDTPQLKKYFNEFDQQLNQQKKERAMSFLFQAEDRLNALISKGNIPIPEQREDIDDLVQQQKQRIIDRAQPKLNQYEQKQQETRIYRQQIARKLKYLENQFNNNSQEILDPQAHLHSVLSKEQHQQLIAKIKKQRMERDKQHRKNLRTMKQHAYIRQKKRQQSAQKILQAQLEERKKKIEQNLQKKKQLHQKILEQEKQTNQKYKQVKQAKPLYQKIEQRYEGEVIKALQQKKKKLKQIRDIKRGLNISELLSHERQYLTQRQNSLQSSRSQDHDKSWSYKPPERSKKLAKIIQQQKVQFRKQQQQKKRAVQQKISRQKAYLQQIKFKHQPHIDLAKQQQIRRRLQQKSPKKAEIDPKIRGMSYLQFAKLMKKKQKRASTQKTSEKNQSDTNTHRNIPQKKVKVGYANPGEDNMEKQFQIVRRKKIDSVTNSNKPRQQKLYELQYQNQKIDQEVKRSQQLIKANNDEHSQQKALQVILTSIKAKMGIIDVLKH